MNSSERCRKLGVVLRRAEEAAIAADPGEGLHNDGGSCNFDAPIFLVHRAEAMFYDWAAKKAEIPPGSFSTFLRRRWYWPAFTLRGQANRRSTMAQAAYDVLKAAEDSKEVPGLHVFFYQQMD